MNKLTNKKYIMAEPVWKWSECEDEQSTEWLWVKAVHWYRCNADIKKKKRWVLDYVKTHLPNEDVAEYRNAKPSLYEEAGCHCKVKMTGCSNETLNIKIDSLLEGIKSNCKKQNSVNTSPKKETKKNFKVNVSDMTSNLVSEVNNYVDIFISSKNINKKEWFNLKEWLTRNSVKQEHASHIMLEMKSMHSEVRAAYQKEDEQVSEAYSFLNHKKLQRLVQFLEGLVDQSEEYLNSHTPKKTTKKKVCPEKMVKKLPRKKDMPEYGIKEIDPKKIVGANCLFVYNAVSRLIIYYQAVPGNGGLGVKGASITHYDEKASFMKKVRSPKHVLNFVSRLTKKHVLEEMEKLSTNKREVRPRLNKNCVLVRII